MSFFHTFLQTEKIPETFGGLLNLTLFSYRSFFLNYILLSLITFTPFILINELSNFDSKGVGFLASRFFDIIIFLTIPTLAVQNAIYPFATLRLFFIRFFGPGVLIAIIQLSVFLFTVNLLFSISPIFLLFSFIPYLLFIFSGFFLVVHAEGNYLFYISRFFADSFRFVSKHFKEVFYSVFFVFSLAMVPIFFFLILFLPETLSKSAETQITTEMLQSVQNEPIIKWGIYAIQIVTRPFESLFLSFLFLSLMSRVNPTTYRNYTFGLRNEVPETSQGVE